MLLERGPRSVDSACDRVERAFFAAPVTPRQAQRLSDARLPLVDWAARLTDFAPDVRGISFESDDLSMPMRTTATPVHVVRAIALAWEHLDVLRAAGTLPFMELYRVARALLAVDGTVRRALAATDLELLREDPAGRMVRAALFAIAVGECVTPSSEQLATIAVAAMAQDLLDEYPRTARAAALLADAVAAEPDAMEAAVIAYEAMRIRQRGDLAEPTMHARLVALACDEARPSLVRMSSPSVVDIRELLFEEEVLVDLLEVEGPLSDSAE